MADTPSLATSLERYAGIAKWVVSLATGMLAVGVGFAGDRDLPPVQIYAFSAAGVLLFLAILAGAFCAIGVVGYAFYSEQTQRARQGVADAAGKDEQLKASAEAAFEDATSKRERGRQWATKAWTPMLWLYGLGLLAVAVLGGLQVWHVGELTDPECWDLTRLPAVGPDGATEVVWDGCEEAFLLPVLDGSGGIQLTPLQVVP